MIGVLLARADDAVWIVQAADRGIGVHHGRWQKARVDASKNLEIVRRRTVVKRYSVRAQFTVLLRIMRG